MELDLEEIVGDISELRGNCVGIERKLRVLIKKIADILKQDFEVPYFYDEEMFRQMDFALASIEDAQNRLRKAMDYSGVEDRKA